MEVYNPILNNPYEEPKYYYGSDAEGNVDYEAICEGRRPFAQEIAPTPNRAAQKTIFNYEEITDLSAQEKFINDIRKAVGNWRNGGYKNVTRITKRLLDFWFSIHERQNYQKLFFCQREAIETAIYFNEVADRDPNVGRNLLHQLQERQNMASVDSAYCLPRIAFKMATGTGKTVVMAMLILYNFFNRHENKQDTRFADRFLLVAPGITIRDRLGVLKVDADPRNANDYYHQRKLIPPEFEGIVRELNPLVHIINYQQLEPRSYQGNKRSPMDGKILADGSKQNEKEDISIVLNRVLDKMPKSNRLLVINDEAHHCYLHGQFANGPEYAAAKKRGKKANSDDDDDDSKNDDVRAMIWYEGLRQISLRYKLQMVYDLSATPYYLKGSGRDPYSLFPWVVSDFGLMDAIESGLVKIPFMPLSDTSQSLSEPKLKNLYQSIREDEPNSLPKKGQKTIRKEKRANGENIEFEAAPQMPSLLNMALEQFVENYMEYDRNERGNGEIAANIFSTPPVFIVVCNNTTVSKEVYKYIAGYETRNAGDEVVNVKGHFDIFSNYDDNGLPKQKPPTLLIDSNEIGNAGNVISDDFKSVFKDEIANFKKEYATLHGAGSADNLTDGDILREVVNSVGKRGGLGAHIRCVVSVSMLTEGWDANTVTHVCGVRAFGSQLLCEQVAGRALRRMNYELLPYDKDGRQIDFKDLHRYKPENITYKFPPEYARIIGIPFKNFKKGSTANLISQKTKIHICPVHPERDEMEITFPNIDGYRVDEQMQQLTADYTGLPKFRLDFTKVPLQTMLANAIQEVQELLDTPDFESIRDQQVIYILTQQLIDRKFFSIDRGKEFHKFNMLKKIVEQWYDDQIEMLNYTDPLQKRLVILWDMKTIIDSIYEGIKNQSLKADATKISAILNYYNPEGSTRHVNGFTTKEVYATTKSHINYVVADTASWEQLAAKTLEEINEVKFYVKNHFLDFKIPYTLDGEEHHYVPDFIARIKAASGKEMNLIIEISGFSNDRTGNKDIKRHYVCDYWIPAANNLKKYPEFAFVEITDIQNIKTQLLQTINSL